MIRAFLAGLADGWDQPRYLSVGLSFGDSRDEAYDRGVNVGQFIRAPFRHQRAS
jgi:hypothetical protein